jgi:predicted dehydrogenase
MIRVCVIGLEVAGSLHADVYRGDELAEVVGMCDVNPQRLHAAAARLGVAAFADLGEMLDALRPDLVSVCVEGDAVAPVRQALQAGCHVLCEAPLAQEVRQARDMVAAARAHSLCLAVNFNLRFTPAALKAKQWLEEGRLGTPLFINTTLWSGPNEASSDDAESLWRLAHHGLDLIRWLCGDIARLQCFAVKTPQRETWSSAQINLETAAGVVGNLTVSRDMATRHPLARCEVAGTTARLVIDNIYEEIALYPHASEEKTIITNSIFGGLGGYEDTHRCRLERLLEQLEAGVAPDEIEGSGAQALLAHLAVEAARMSLESGEVVGVASL